MSSKAGPEVVPEGTEIAFNNVPTLYATGAQISHIANDMIITFTGTKIGSGQQNGKPATVAQIIPILDLTVGVLTLKEIGVAIQEVVERYERENGEIVSPALRAVKD